MIFSRKQLNENFKSIVFTLMKQHIVLATHSKMKKKKLQANQIENFKNVK